MTFVILEGQATEFSLSSQHQQKVTYKEKKSLMTKIKLQSLMPLLNEKYIVSLFPLYPFSPPQPRILSLAKSAFPSCKGKARNALCFKGLEKGTINFTPRGPDVLLQTKIGTKQARGNGDQAQSSPRERNWEVSIWGKATRRTRTSEIPKTIHQRCNRGLGHSYDRILP